jgi:RimJ/RimL family protein N-acetyltransferase
MNEYFTKDGRSFTIQNPTADHAEGIINYSKALFASTDQVLTTLDEYTITVENEKKWIENLNDNPNSLVLIAEMSKTIVGLLFFMPNSKNKNSHTGEFGINVHPDFQGVGVGRVLLENLLMWARTNRQIEKISLQVFATNHSAIKLYERFGFIEEGRHIKAIKQLDGKYVDVLQMYIETN